MFKSQQSLRSLPCPALQAARKSPTPQLRRRTSPTVLFLRRRKGSAKRTAAQADNSQPTLATATPPDAQPNAQSNFATLLPKSQLTPVTSDPESAVPAVQSSPQQSPQPLPVVPVPSSDAPDPIALKWAAKNPWFGSEMDMTYFAYEVHDQLIEQEGITADMPEYYTAISARVEAEFPERFLAPGTLGVQRQGSVAMLGGQAPQAAMYRQNSSIGTGMYRQGSSLGAQSASANASMSTRLYKGSSTVAAMMQQQQLQQPVAPRLYRGASTVAATAGLQQPSIAPNRPVVPLLPLQDQQQAISPRQEGPRSSRGVGSLYDQSSGTPRLTLTDS